MCYVFLFKQRTAYEMRISDWSSDVCSSDLVTLAFRLGRAAVMLLCEALRDGGGGGISGRQRGDGKQGKGVFKTHLKVLYPCHAPLYESLADRSLITPAFGIEIGRASCRERVCQYV